MVWNNRLIAAPGAFRLVLALMVVASHISKWDIGRLAVLLFFLLSGYWVSKIWHERFSHRRTHWFYVSRYLRIAPLYFIVLLASMMVTEGVGIANFLLLSVASSDVDPIGTSWSLDIELQFYLLVPILIAVAVGRYSAYVFAASLAVAAFAWIVVAPYGVVTIFQYLPAFLIGALIQVYDWRPSARIGVGSLAAFVVMTGVAAVLPYTHSFLDKTLPDPFDRDVFGFLWMLPLVPYVACSLRQRSSPMDRHLGNLSYPLYLVHYPLIAVFIGFGPSPAWRALGAVSAVVLAVLVYVLVDRPFERLRTWLTELPKPPQPLSASV